MKISTLLLILSVLALSLTACKHRNKQTAHPTKNPIAYPTTQYTGSVSTGYGYVK